MVRGCLDVVSFFGVGFSSSLAVFCGGRFVTSRFFGSVYLRCCFFGGAYWVAVCSRFSVVLVVFGFV